MKRISILTFVFLSFISYAQLGNVGINSVTPKATLEINMANVNENNDTNQGILIPRLSKTRVANIHNDSLKTGTLVYVNNTDYTTSTPNDKVKNIKIEGFYYYDNSYWQHISDKSTIETTNSLGGKEYTNPKYTIIRGAFTPTCNKKEDTYIVYRTVGNAITCRENNGAFKSFLESPPVLGGYIEIDLSTMRKYSYAYNLLQVCRVPVDDNCRINGIGSYEIAGDFIEKVDFTPSNL